MKTAIIKDLKRIYNQLGIENLNLLGDLYTTDIVFIDPFHRVDGLRALTRYFEDLYQNLLSIHFDYIDEMITENGALLTWRMAYAHRSIKNGNPISVEGATHLKFDHKIHFHHDYFDASAMIFEHLPVIGTILHWIRKRVSQ